MLFVNRVFAFMMPLMMLIMNGLTLAIIWVGSHQVALGEHAGGRHDGVPAVRHADRLLVPDAVVHVHHPAARVGVGRPRRGGAGDGGDASGTRSSRSACPSRSRPAGAAIEFTRCRFRYPGAEEDVLHDISFTALPGQMTAFIGADRRGQVDAGQPDPALLRRERRLDLRGRRRHPRGHAARPARQDRLRAAEGHALLGHDREQPALCRRRRAARTSWPRPRRSRRRPSSSRPGPRGWRRRSPRAARTCRAARSSGSRSPARW